MQGAKKRLGELLMEQGWVQPRDVEAALARQASQGGRIGGLLVEAGIIGEQTLLQALAAQLGVDVVEVTDHPRDAAALAAVPYGVAKKYRALPLKKEPRLLHVAMPEPQDAESIQALEFATGMRIRAHLCSAREIDIALEQHYGMEEALEKIVRNVTQEADLDGSNDASIVQVDAPSPGERATGRPGDPGQDMAPIIRLVNLILMEAARKEASDIHFEPNRHYLQVRFRLDGVLRRRMSIPKYLQQSVLSRIKVTARMDIAKKRTPQDGGIRLQVDGRRLDLRVSSLPTFYGEKIVIRLLDQTERKVDFSMLGLEGERRKALEACCRRPQGMILVTGPTGSGKSTTLQCILKDLRSEGTNIITVEDPIEYELEGINQVQVQREAGLTFADSLRAILRQDPNVIMVGEIRDSETAEVAFRAALTGHLVLSTLHTNDTVSTVTRLVDMGVPPFLISSALLAVISQRLVRRICTGCRVVAEPEPSALESLPDGLMDRVHSLHRGEGCSQCEQTGYKGRVGVFEILVLSPGLRKDVARGADERAIRDRAVGEGMVALLEDGIEKIRQGVTTLEEVLSAAYWDGPLGATQTESPFPSPEAESVRPDRESLSKDPVRPTIVYAEDDPAVREAVCLSLEALSCDVIPADDGEEGWEKVQRHLPDLVITDIEMPRLDGYGLLEKIRTELGTAFIPVILLTGRNRCEDRMKGFLLGGDDYIEKPFDHRELLTRVKRCLERNAFVRREAGPRRALQGSNGIPY
jgi:type IV pilus assembly protein PilB